MGKVLSRFTNGFTGAVSRSVDNIVSSMGNASGGDIPFGAPVFLQPGENGHSGPRDMPDRWRVREGYLPKAPALSSTTTSRAWTAP